MLVTWRVRVYVRGIQASLNLKRPYNYKIWIFRYSISGGGLVFPHTVRQKTTYILRGIVSTGGNKDGSCDSDKYTTFTNVAFHMDFVNTHISKYEPKF